jgi:hypothetical protein
MVAFLVFAKELFGIRCPYEFCLYDLHKQKTQPTIGFMETSVGSSRFRLMLHFGFSRFIMV